MKHFLMLAALLAGAFCMADDLLVNGDMKTNKGWVPWGRGPKNPADKMKTIAYVNEGPNGERVLKFEENFTDCNPYLFQLIPVSGVTAEQKYKASFQLKAEKGQQVTVMLQMFGAKFKFLGIRNAVVTGTGEWKKYDVTFTKPIADTEKFGLAFSPLAGKAMADKAQTGSFLLADVSLELVK